jgi:hypothetical protein
MIYGNTEDAAAGAGNEIRVGEYIMNLPTSSKDESDPSEQPVSPPAGKRRGIKSGYGWLQGAQTIYNNAKGTGTYANASTIILRNNTNFALPAGTTIDHPQSARGTPAKLTTSVVGVTATQP